MRYRIGMRTNRAPGHESFDSPATYRIQIQGKLDASWSELLEGMAIQAGETDGGAPVTTLYGVLPDQAALAGVLNQLYCSRVTVLTVTRVEGVHG
jgi:hypothetical protein